MDLIARIDAHEEEADALDTILDPVLHQLMQAHGMVHTKGWYLNSFTTTHDGWIKMEAIDTYDSETRHFKIPAGIIEDNKVAEYCAQLKDSLAEEKAKKAEDARRSELARLEARTRILRGELSGG